MSRPRAAWQDFHRTGPGTLAGRFLRRYWQPVFHSADLARGRAKPVRIMGADYTLYRGEDGVARLLDARCPHRGMQLSPGWVEGQTIRCFYHGWRFDGTGQCVEQPAEPKTFARKVRIGAYPCVEYLGLVFAYLGEGKPPELPRYAPFENVAGVLEHDSYLRPCNYFNNLENATDLVHSGFVHRNNPGAHDGFVNPPRMDAEESCWGVTVYARWPDQTSVSQIGVPNVFHHKAQPTDPAIAPYREFLAFWVPVDDASHIQFTVAAVRLPPEQAMAYVARRDERIARRTQSRVALAQAVLRGELDREDVDPAACDFVRFQDDVAQIGQGRVDEHGVERLGQSDRALILLRKVWSRELKRLHEGKPLKRWQYDPAALAISRGESWERRYQQVQAVAK